MENLQAYILTTLVIVCSNIIQTITGFAGVMLAMPPSIKLIGASDARFVLNVIVILNCFIIVLFNRSYINYKELRKILMIMISGCIAGMIIFKIFPLEILLTLYGAFIIVIAVKKLFFPNAGKVQTSLYTVILIAAGLIQGMFLSGGALLVIYASEKLKEKAEFRATISSVWIILNGIILAIDCVTSSVSTRALRLTLMNIIPLILSILIGNYLYHKINQKWFGKITYVLLFISGILVYI